MGRRERKVGHQALLGDVQHQLELLESRNQQLLEQNRELAGHLAQAATTELASYGKYISRMWIF